MAEILTTRIRATFGPLHLVSLYSGRWAAVNYNCVPDEAVAKAILAEDAGWFNTEPTQDGACNPTYADKADAISAIVDMLGYLHSEGPDARLSAAIEDAVGELIYAQEERHGMGASSLTPHGEPDVVAQPADDADSVVKFGQDAVIEAPVSRPESANQEGEAPAPQAAEAEQPLPWADLDGIAETNLLYKMPPDVVAKMTWIMKNVPQMSKQRIVREPVMAYLDAQIAAHYKP